MFETSRRSHPLHTFRFWFVVVAAGLVTVAWKFDLLPFRVGPAETGRLTQQEPDDSEGARQTAGADSPSDLDLPFSGSDTALSVPTIAPESSHSSEESPRQTARLDAMDDSLLTGQSEPAGLGESPAAGSPGSPPLGMSDWPSPPPAGNGVVSASAQSEPEAGAADNAAASTGIVQTSATTTSFETGDSSDVEPVDQPTGATDILQEPSSAEVDFTQIDELLASGRTNDEIEAHRQLSTLYWKQPASRDALRDRIDRLAQRIYFQNSRHYMDAYEVQPGDTLEKIARQYDVTWQYLAKLNRVDPRKVRAGQRLKVIKGPFSAIVDLSDYELTVHAHGYFVTRYPVGIGKDGSSPIGKFAVEEKLVDPTYYGPDGVIANDDPANPLGERWIDIGDSYGLHGTINPASIGKNESKGCIRLHNADVEAVYDLLTTGSEVVIRP